MSNKQLGNGIPLLMDEEMGSEIKRKFRCPFCGATDSTRVTKEKKLTIDCSQGRIVSETGTTSTLCGACGISRGHGYGVVYFR